MTRYFFLYFCLIKIIFSEKQGCDFESNCRSLLFDGSWGETSGSSPFRPEAPNYDHTYKNSTGHYMFFDSTSEPKYKDSTILFNDIFNLTNKQQNCLQFYYIFKSDRPLNLTVKLLMGDLKELEYTWLNINGFSSQTTNWTLGEVNLPNDAFWVKISLELSKSSAATNVLFTIDDIFITDTCSQRLVKESQVLNWCDFESSDCGYENTMRLEMKRVKASESDESFPKTDHSLNTENGHYMVSSKLNDIFVNNGFIERIVSPKITIPNDGIPYCVSFYYYTFKQTESKYPNIYLFAIPQDSSDDFIYQPNNEIWTNYQQKVYKSWSWGIANLVPGKIRLGFLIANNEELTINGAIDDIKIHTCFAVNNPKLSYDDEKSSNFEYKCDFEKDRCGFSETYDNKYPSNWTRINGKNSLFPQLGPNVDHTTSSDLGYFLAVNISFPLRINFAASTRSLLLFSHNEMCVEFYFYSNTEMFNPLSDSMFGVSVGGCYGTTLLYTYPFRTSTEPQWSKVILQFKSFVCQEFLTFTFRMRDLNKQSIAIDDFRVDRCDKINPPTTTPSTTTTTKMSSTTRESITNSSTTTTIKTSTLTTSQIETTETNTELSTTVSLSSDTFETTILTTSPNNQAEKIKLKFVFLIISFTTHLFLT